MSQEFTRTESRILGALSKLDDFLFNTQLRTHPGTIPGTFPNTNVENQGTNEDDSQSDPHPEAGIFRSQTTKNSGPKFGHDVVTRVQKQGHCGHDKVTGGQEEIPYCSPGTSPGKLKKARSTSQPQFHIENTPVTIEADQILLALQQLVTNSTSAKFNKNIKRISKLPKSSESTMPTVDGKLEKLELFEDLFQTSSKIHNQLTEEDKTKYFHSLMGGDALQTFKNSIPNRENLIEILTVFRRKYMKSQSRATAKHKFQHLVFNPANQKLIVLSDELQKMETNAF